MGKQPNIQRILYDLWYNHYESKDGQQRVALVNSLLKDELRDCDITRIKRKHPAYLHSHGVQRYKQHSVAKILADFILRSEDDKTRLTVGPQTEAYRQNVTNQREILTDFSDHYNDEVGSEGVRHNTEVDVYKARGDLYSYDADAVTTTDDLRAMITYRKAYAKEFAEMYADKQQSDYASTLRLIKRLDLDRVAECNQCGGAYYRHDLRSKVCDITGICRRQRKSEQDRQRYLRNKSKKVKDRADT